MLFVELRFFLFFAAVLGCYWLLRGNSARKLLLVGASYLFYAAWDWRFLGLIWFSTVMDYLVGRALARMPPSPWRRRLLALSIASNLAILFVFKYFNFFVSPFSHWTVQLILPAGISFYTFETISYTVDVYRGSPPARSLLDFALFLAFFPHLVAGPILRPGEFLPQLTSARSASDVRLRPDLLLVLAGFVKKACIADNLAPFVDAFFAHPAGYGTSASWVGALFWAAQIYCDFSGYSDMAVGCAGLLGYRLVPNFDAPYLASSVTELWRRWHMSLGRFLRDYLYIPLGGNRGSRWFGYRNLMITMLIGGLWHGASWRFLIWGAIHGVALVLERALRPRPPRWLGVALTFSLWTGGMVVFRAPSLSSAWVVLGALAGAPSGAAPGPASGFLWLAALALTHGLLRRHPPSGWWRALRDWHFAALYGAGWALVLPFVQLGYTPFVYFQF